MKSHIETITPEDASQMLNKSLPNRQVRVANVEFLKREITEGRWRLNGETIIFDKDGFLIDGQHRLLAIAESGIAVQSWIVRGVDRAAFPTLDTGKMRIGRDLISLTYPKNAILLASALNYVYRYERGSLSTNRNPCPTSAVIDYMGKHKELANSAWVASRIKGLITASVAVAFHYLFSKFDQELADILFEALKDGRFGLGDPVYMLREKLIKNQSRTRGKMQTTEVVALLIKAWNLKREGRRVSLLKWSSEESFPVIK